MEAGTAADSGNSGVAASTASVLNMSDAAGVEAHRPDGVPAIGSSCDDASRTARARHRRRHRSLRPSSMRTASSPAEAWSPTTGTVDDACQHGDVATAVSLGRGAPRRRPRVHVGGGGADSGVQDHPNAEIFSPPYLSSAGAADDRLHPDDAVLPDRSSPCRRRRTQASRLAPHVPGSVTHAFNQNQRFVSLEFVDETRTA